MSSEKTYPIPEELHELYLEMINYQDLKIDFVHSHWFGFKRAVKAGLLFRKKHNEFWILVLELYPELKGKEAHYNSELKEIYF